MNSIASSTVCVIWTRPRDDSLQARRLAPKATTWADLRAGAGFPGLVLRCALADTCAASVHPDESSTKKAAFLTEAARVTAAPAVIHAVRVVDFVNNHLDRIEVVTARALAPLPKLIAEAYPLLKRGTVG